MTGKRPQVEDLFPPLPADHPLFRRGYVIGMRRSGSSSTSGADPSAQPPENPKAPSPDTSKPAAEE